MALAKRTDPLVLADGTKIDPQSGQAIKNKKSQGVQVPTAREAQALVVATRRRLEELPVAPKQMNALGLIAFYTMYGLSDDSIGLALSLPTNQIERIKTQDIYRDIVNELRAQITAIEVQNVRGMLESASVDAARGIIQLAKDESDNALGLAAMRDILDRAGHRPNDVVEHRHRMEGALRIEIVKRDVELPETVIEGVQDA